MTREQLTQYISDPQALLQLNYEELKSIVMQFPYATNLRLLLYQKSALENHKDAERHLQMVSTYTTDRKRLYHLVQSMQPQKIKQTESEVLQLTALSAIEKLRTERDALKIETLLHSVEEKKSLALALMDETTNNNLLDDKKELEISEKLIVPSDISEVAEPTFHLSDLIKTENTPSDVILSESVLESPEAEIKSAETAKEILPEVKKPVIDLEITNASAKQLDAAQLAFNNLSLQEKLSFSEWLNQFRTFSNVEPAHNGLSKTLVVAPAETKPLVEEKATEHVVENLAYDVEPVKKSEKILNDELMAQMFGEANSVSDSLFLPTSPRNDLGIAAMFRNEGEESDEVLDDSDAEKMTAPKIKKKREMHTLAVKSIVSDEDIASETLADLLVLQGNNKKAINMYKRLSLQNPDKIHYFAEKIRELMND